MQIFLLLDEFFSFKKEGFCLLDLYHYIGNL